MKTLYIIIGIVIFLWLIMLITDIRILIEEVKVEPGQEYYVEDWGNVGEASQASLVCNYFNGRKITTKVLWYSPNNILGKDSCPFVYKE